MTIIFCFTCEGATQNNFFELAYFYKLETCQKYLPKGYMYIMYTVHVYKATNTLNYTGESTYKIYKILITWYKVQSVQNLITSLKKGFLIGCTK